MAKRHLFLFNNLILLVKKRPNGRFATKHAVPLDTCLLWDTIECPDGNALKIVRTDTPDKVLLFFVSKAFKDSWVEKINACIAEDGCFFAFGSG